MKSEDVKKLVFLAIGAFLGLASSFIFDFYKTSSSEQRIFWARDYDAITAGKVCENENTGTTRLLLRNTSKRNATVKLVFDGEVTAATTNPKHIIEFNNDTPDVSEITVKDLVSKENVDLLVCGTRFKSPAIETVIASGKSQNSAKLSTNLKEHSFNEPFGFIKILSKVFGLLFLVVLIYQLGHFDGLRHKNSSKEEEPKT